MTYNDFNLIKANDDKNYSKFSKKAIDIVKGIFDELLSDDENEVILKSNLRNGLPIENINKIAGPVLEEWVFTVLDSKKEQYGLLQVKPQKKTALSDVDLKCTIESKLKYIKIDVKATCEEM